jgi:hypothetical protein
MAKHATECKTCDIVGCEKESEKSLNIKQVTETSLNLKSSDLRNVHLCKEHYKEYKKETRQSRDLNSIY